MSLNADALIDRSYLKGQITKWRVIAILVIVLSGILLVGKFAPASGSYVARVKVEGVIMDDLKRGELLTELQDDDRVKAVMLWVDSPGGTVVGGEQLYLDISRLAKAKPVIAVMRSMATSAGYMVTLGATRVYARQGTITGSIGVIMQAAEITDMVHKLGITPVTIKSGVNKAAPNPFEKFTPENQQAMEVVVNDFFQVFVGMVVANRNLTPEKVKQLADGRVYTGNQALELGLIDAIGGEEDGMEWLEKEGHIVSGTLIKDRLPKSDSPESLTDLFGQMVEKMTFLSKMPLDGLVAIWQP